MSDTAIVIPARLDSTRFPGKVLTKIRSKPMLQYVVDAAEMALGRDNVFVASADGPIISYCQSQGINVIPTLQSHVNGTTRIAEAAQNLDHDFIINLQADEPLIPPQVLLTMAQKRRVSTAEILSCYVEHELGKTANDNIRSQTVVKVVVSKSGQALYFSRNLIPFGDAEAYKTHVGLYAFTRQSLQAYVRLEPSPLEILESLEQLRALENGWRIDMFETQWHGQSVDTPAELVVVEELMRERAVS